MIKVKDRWFRIIIILVPLVLLVQDYLNAGVRDSKTTIALLVSIAALVAICEGARLIIYRSRGLSARRSKLQALGVWLVAVVYISAILIVSHFIKNYVVLGRMNSLNDDISIQFNSTILASGVIATNILNAALIFLILFVAYELLYHFARLRFTEIERDQTEKEKLRIELQQLKGVVNPHFLFNNLNSLSALISENPAEAEKFLDELTKVFRYLLRNNQTELIDLGAELGFIRSYYNLLHSRYGGSLLMSINIADPYLTQMLPPMTLQLLVENAVKHNRLQKDNPLHLEIFISDDEKLIVRNNLRKKEGKVESTGIGLKSINARYHILDQEGLKIEQSSGSFCVYIPLLKMTDDESSHTES